jgi:hypothetical protein
MKLGQFWGCLGFLEEMFCTAHSPCRSHLERARFRGESSPRTTVESGPRPIHQRGVACRQGALAATARNFASVHSMNRGIGLGRPLRALFRWVMRHSSYAKWTQIAAIEPDTVRLRVPAGELRAPDPLSR